LKNIKSNLLKEMDKHNPREAYRLKLIDMLHFWDSLSQMEKNNYLEYGLPKVYSGKYKNTKCLVYRGMPVILK